MSELFSLSISYENLETQKKDKSEDLSYLVDQTPKISNLLEDLRKVERFAQYIENQGIENLTKGTTSFQSDAVEEMNGEKRRR
jgi:hypothetical protein